MCLAEEECILEEGGSGVCLSDGAIMRQRPDEDVFMFLPEGLLGKEQRCSRMTLFALDNLSAQRKNITSAGDDSNKDGLKHGRTVAEVRVFALCLTQPQSASEQNQTHFFHRAQSTSLPQFQQVT